jgi:hypothetical protein
MARLPMDRQASADAVIRAFTHAGLTVTNTTANLVEADQGNTTDGFTGGGYRRVVRAIVLPTDSGAEVVMVGLETRSDEHGRVFKQLRIDNHAKGNGAKVWAKMTAAGAELDSVAAAVSAPAPTTQ